MVLVRGSVPPNPPTPYPADRRSYSIPDVISRGHGGSIVIHNDNDNDVAPASGSFVHHGMIVVPCSSNTLGRIAGGITDNLVQRAAFCTLKERRTLVLAHRESPLSSIDLDNMQRVTAAGGIIAPLSPGFSLLPKSLDDIVDFMVGKLLDLVGVRHGLAVRWDEHLDEASRTT
jgi:4-hydroxy-3-polyprenylbenzoate decarboxylase